MQPDSKSATLNALFNTVQNVFTLSRASRPLKNLSTLLILVLSRSANGYLG